eukprot:CAMPEP_0172461204 /NCGR_PEP_ID=MMETSP1065-20121228/39644_1 /TAXON_ID=265537 /ORGANISM="Amphiprora paludosa, Strain CCMP125" /LENGTH=41 /DNA_ID= /DNA_START= /DNA_END= /DNA_ORIENTATION=
MCNPTATENDKKSEPETRSDDELIAEGVQLYKDDRILPGAG